jgi:hypothetical protein
MAKKSSQLVCQHLENMSRRMLEEYQGVIRDFVRGRNGVYALYRRGKLYYVGLASSLLGRLRHHLRDHHAGTWDRFSVYLTIGPAHMKEIESLLLRISSPPGNKVRGKFARSDNLLLRVKTEYRHLRKEEEAELFGFGRRPRKPERKEAKTPPRIPKGQRVPLAQYVEHVGKCLRGRYKGKAVKAWVRRNGRIRFNHMIYNSPSRAAAVACGRSARDGWRFWTYERAPGDWVPLDKLRR